MAKDHPGPLDMNERAYLTMRQVTDKHDETIDDEEAAAFLGRPNHTPEGRSVESGWKGATARNRNLTPEQRSEIAKRAAEARWKKSEPEEDDKPE